MSTRDTMPPDHRDGPLVVQGERKLLAWHDSLTDYLYIARCIRKHSPHVLTAMASFTVTAKLEVIQGLEANVRETLTSSVNATPEVKSAPVTINRRVGSCHRSEATRYQATVSAIVTRQKRQSGGADWDTRYRVEEWKMVLSKVAIVVGGEGGLGQFGMLQPPPTTTDERRFLH